MTAASNQNHPDTDRVAALEACAIMDTPPEEEFDFLARLAAEVCGTKMAGITFIGAERQFYKSAVGMEAPDIPREESFCQHTVSSAASMIVEDTLADERFRASPLVTGGPEIRFYAGAPLRTREGEVLGALCVMDTEPRRLEPHQLELLQGLAKQVTTLVEQRRDESDLTIARGRLDRDELLAHVAAWEWDSVTDDATWTTELRALLGVGDEVKGTLKTFMSLVHEDDRAHVNEQVKAAMDSGGSFSYRNRIVRPDGEVRTVDNQGEVQLDDQGVPRGMCGATVDVTSLVKAEHRSREQAEGLSAAFEAALDPILVSDGDGRYVQVNQAACSLLGYSREELLAMRVSDLATESKRDESVAAWEKVEQTGQVRGEIELRKADGTVAVVEYGATANFVPGHHLSVFRDVTQRREAEREARESHRRLEETQALAMVGSWGWDLESDLRLTSPELLRILGRTPESEAPSYEEFAEYIHPADRAAYEKVVETALRDKRPFHQVFRVITETGETRTVESHGRVEVNERGEPTRMYGAAQDITDRERVANELRLQADVLDQVPAGVIATGKDRRVTQWSRGAEVLFGLPREEALGHRFDELGLIPPESREAREAMRERLQQGQEWEGEIGLCGRTGRMFTALATNSPVRDSRGEVAGYVGVIVDLTERQTFEKEVGLQGHLLDQVEAAVIAMDLDRRITHWNRGAERLYGWSREEAVGRHAGELDLVTGASQAAMTLRALDGESWEGEIEVRRKDGTTFPAFASNSALLGTDNSPTGYVGVSVDITKQKNAENEARAARLGTIKRLATAVEKRDPETGGHIERIGDYAAMIAERLGMKPERVELIRVSSTMHDVGKVGIPDDILLKPGKLTAEERAAMEKHTTIGFDILVGSGADLLDLASTIALTHHERVDGKGYPSGLSGADIPIEGRIVAVADVFDALTSDRVYRKAFSVERSIEIMEEGRGTQFDPAILDVLLEILESFTGSGLAPTPLELADRARGFAPVAVASAA